MKTLQVGALAAPLLSWYPSHARDLPWRHTQAVYPVWVSEIMLQQTRVEAVVPYYTRFLTQFPDVYALAQAAPDTLQKAWEGLGYYARARHMAETAQIVVQDYGGVFPKTLEELRALPGIGAYTAGALCSLCYGMPTPAVDGNVLRVVARFCAIETPVDQANVKTAITEALTQVYLAHPNDCAMLTQSLMELGATVCIPKAPHCDVCPLAAQCRAQKEGKVLVIPVHTPKKPRRVEKRTVFFLLYEDKVAIRRRPKTGLLSSLWEYPSEAGTFTPEAAIQQAEAWGCAPQDFLGTLSGRHIFTHVEWEMTGMVMRCGACPAVFQWETPEKIQNVYPLPTAFRQFSASLMPFFRSAEP